MIPVAAVQFFATPIDTTRNWQTTERLVRQAARLSPQLVALPELFNTGYVYSPRLPSVACNETDITLARLLRLSRELNLLVVGAIPFAEHGRLFIAAVLTTPQGETFIYKKQRPLLWERRYFSAGHGAMIARTALGRVGFLVGWDAGIGDLWQAYRGHIDLLVVCSAAPRLHRAVLNYPLGKKLYLAEVAPSFLHQRDALDTLFESRLSHIAATLNTPVVYSAMAGRFVSAMPRARLGLLAATAGQPKHWRTAMQTHLASMRGTFYGDSAVYDSQGAKLSAVESEEGIAIAPVHPSQVNVAGPPPTPVALRLPHNLKLMQWVMRF